MAPPLPRRVWRRCRSCLATLTLAVLAAAFVKMTATRRVSCRGAGSCALGVRDLQIQLGVDQDEAGADGADGAVPAALNGNPQGPDAEEEKSEELPQLRKEVMPGLSRFFKLFRLPDERELNEM
eukprot:Skav215390  [mRNA]  locus=scaffold3390:32327:46851:- [translate_table: standard]